MDIQFTISMNPDGNTIDDVTLSSDIKQVYTDAFAVLIENPFDLDGAIDDFKQFYQSRVVEYDAVAPTEVSTDNVKIAQLDMDGNITKASSVPSFSDTKEQVKNLLGSVERISANEILIADSKNKRAIIINDVTQNIIWQYDSDRYIIDAHRILKDNVTIKINTATDLETVLNNNQIIIWENELSTPIKIYSGNIDDVDVSVDFDENLYGDIFESITLNQNQKWAFKFTSIGEFDWFTYPIGIKGKVIVSDNKLSSTNQFILTESDGLESPYTGRIIKVDCWGNLIWKFGEGYIVKPRDARAMINNNVIVSV